MEKTIKHLKRFNNLVKKLGCVDFLSSSGCLFLFSVVVTCMLGGNLLAQERDKTHSTQVKTDLINSLFFQISINIGMVL